MMWHVPLTGRRALQNPGLAGSRRRSSPRLRLEQLEDRLPPGDTVVAGLLAAEFLPGRAAGLIPAEGHAVPPGQARRLANPAPFDLAADLELLADAPAPVNSGALASRGTAGAHARGYLGALTQRRSPTSSLAPPLASLVASAPGDGSAQHSALSTQHSVLGALTQPRSPSTPIDYQLDQAVAALALSAVTLADNEGTRGAPVRALFNLGHPTTGPFPSNWFTVFDDTQNTWRRVSLPYPDCTVYVSDCEDLAVLNELDGFNLQPRLSIPFSGPIDVTSVNSATVFLVSLGSTTAEEGFMPRGYGVGINQIVWDVETNSLHVESDELLAQHTRFALYVTTGVRDTNGNPVGATEAFRNFRQTVQGDYREHLHDAMLMAGAYGFRERDIVVASVFTTQSTTAVLEKMRDQIHAGTPEPADFLLGPKGERTVFPLAGVTGITWRQQTEVYPPVFNPMNLNLALLRDIYPDAVGELAFGKYLSPDYEVHPGEYIPAVATRTGTPVVQGVNEISFNLVLPSGPRPANGWPVVIFGPGATGNKNGAMTTQGGALAQHGIATLLINFVAQGFGPLGTLTVNQTSGGPVTVPAGGRGIDQDGDNIIGPWEGFFADRPQAIIDTRDGQRQTVADLMQLVRVIQVGMDVHGDGVRDLDASRIYYWGLSLGGAIGVEFLAVEPDVLAGLPLVTGGSTAEVTRLSPNNRPLAGSLAARVPPLLNPPGIDAIGGVAVTAPYFNDNKPLRNGVPLHVRLEDGTEYDIRSPVVNTVAGAMAIQEVIDNQEWVSLSGDNLGYVSHLRKDPLPGVPAKSVLFVFAKGDYNVPNPTTTALLRAGDLADRATFYRNDRAFAEEPRIPKNPHTFVNGIMRPDIPLWFAIALGAREQAATFFESHGTVIICPEPARFFECPIKGPLPEGLNYIP